MSNRDNQLVLLGATGFTGKWVAKHLYDNYQGVLRWSMAGRSVDKLTEVSQFINDSKQEVGYVIADSADEASLRQLVKNTDVIISTVGPYALYGSLLVQLCAEEGTHYVDLSGEVPWMRDMIDAHDETARKSGARIVHSCGFDSIPSDFGVFYLQQAAKERFQDLLTCVRFALLKSKGGMSGGTVASMMNVIKQAVASKQVRSLLKNPYSLNPDPGFRGAIQPDQRGVQYNKELEKWTAPFLMAGINTRIVHRSNALMGFSYGEGFLYSETMSTGQGVSGYLTAKVISVGIKFMALMGVTSWGRSFLGMFMPRQGDGPVVDPQNPGFYVVQLNGESETGESLACLVKGDADPGYGSTAKMLAEAGVSLALDEIQVGGGFWTPASCMGQSLLDRLQSRAGLSFELVD